MAIELDCASADMARSSLAALLGISDSELDQRIASLSPDALYPMTAGQADNAATLWEHLTTQAETAPSAIFWFHATRVLQDASFATDGILPLKDMLPRIETLLKKLMQDCPDAERQDEEDSSSVGNPFALAMRLEMPEGQGPDAFLVREAIFDKSGAQHNFVDAPEAVEDVAAMLAGSGAAALLECFRSASRPYIVKFRTTSPDRRAAWASL